MGIIEESQKLNPDPIVELFYFDFRTRIEGPSGTMVFLTNEQGSITYQGLTYNPASIVFKAPELSLDTSVNKGQITVHGQQADILNAINTYEKLRGSTFYYVLTHEKFLDGNAEADVTAYYAEKYIIDAIKEKSKSRIVFEVTPGVGFDNLNKPALRSISV